MRIVLPLIALLLTSAATARQAPSPSLVLPAVPDGPVLSPGGLPDGAMPCTDRIHEVREERGLPRLERGPAAPDEPLMIAAVDHRIDGCSVLVMRHDTRDVRPLPTRERPAQIERIPGG